MFDIFSLYDQPFSPNYWEILHRAGGYYTKIQETFSQEFVDEFLQAHQDLTQLEQDECYREGFRDGVFFMAHSFLSLPGSPKTPSP